MDTVDFIDEFERLFKKLKKQDIELPKGIPAYKLLKSTDIFDEKQHFA